MAGISRKTLWYASHDTLAGRIFAAATSKGLTEIAINCGKKEFLKRLKERRPGFTPIEDAGRFARVFKALDRYFDGKAVHFDMPLDLCGSQFEISVWEALKRIPWGRTLSYKEVAALLKKPGAARAVGNACGKNPVPIIIPCHRVIKCDGGLGGYTGGAGTKKTLLEIEGSV